MCRECAHFTFIFLFRGDGHTHVQYIQLRSCCCVIRNRKIHFLAIQLISSKTMGSVFLKLKLWFLFSTTVSSSKRINHVRSTLARERAHFAIFLSSLSFGFSKIATLNVFSFPRRARSDCLLYIPARKTRIPLCLGSPRLAFAGIEERRLHARTQGMAVVCVCVCGVLLGAIKHL